MTASTPSAPSASWITRHPVKLLYVLIVGLYTGARLPFWLLYYLPRRTRPHPRWTWRQALMTHLLRVVLHHMSAIQTRTPHRLTPDKEKARWVVIPPAAEKTPRRSSSSSGSSSSNDGDDAEGKLDLYSHGVLASNPSVVPLPLGATWYPSTPPPSPPLTGPVCLHLHGGAFVIGTGRAADLAYLAQTILRQTPCTHLLAPQYRLASMHTAPTSPDGRFPAALQDALTAYAHLIHTLRVPASRVVLSGDSAGATIALSLLRHLAAHPSASLPPPAAAWLWSPWVDPAAARDEAAFARNPNRGTDYITAGFGAWGVRALTRTTAGVEIVSPVDGYVSPVRRPFATSTRLWVHVGGGEVLAEQIERFVAGMRGEGCAVGVVVEEAAPHDIVLLGNVLGWEKEAAEGARKAGEWLQGVLEEEGKEESR